MTPDQHPQDSEPSAKLAGNSDRERVAASFMHEGTFRDLQANDDWGYAAADVALAALDVTGLRAENERLRDERRTYEVALSRGHAAEAQRDALAAEIEQLRADASLLIDLRDDLARERDALAARLNKVRALCDEPDAPITPAELHAALDAPVEQERGEGYSSCLVDD